MKKNKSKIIITDDKRLLVNDGIALDITLLPRQMPLNYLFKFGKYTNRTVKDVMLKDEQYVKWFYTEVYLPYAYKRQIKENQSKFTRIVPNQNFLNEKEV